MSGTRPHRPLVLAVAALAALPPGGARAQTFATVRAGVAGGIASDALPVEGPAFAAQMVFRFPNTFRLGAFADFRNAEAGTRANLGVRGIVGSREPHVVDISAAVSAGLAHDGRGPDDAERGHAEWGFVLGVGGSLAVKCGFVWIDVGIDWLLQAIKFRRNTYALATVGLRVPFARYAASGP